MGQATPMTAAPTIGHTHDRPFLFLAAAPWSFLKGGSGQSVGVRARKAPQISAGTAPPTPALLARAVPALAFPRLNPLLSSLGPTGLPDVQRSPYPLEEGPPQEELVGLESGCGRVQGRNWKAPEGR